MFVYLALRFWPRAATVAKTAIRINDNITAYSTAVAALSSEKNRIKLFMAYLRRAASASGRERDGIFLYLCYCKHRSRLALRKIAIGAIRRTPCDRARTLHRVNARPNGA